MDSAYIYIHDAKYFKFIVQNKDKENLNKLKINIEGKKYFKRVRKTIPWLSDIEEKALLDIAPNIRVTGKTDSICLKCRGAKNLCGRDVCPIILRMRSYSTILNKIRSKVIYGSSPPDVFVGRYGYPKVYVGPLLPPFTSNTEIYGKPEYWSELSVDEILKLRYKLIRGKYRVHIKEDIGKDKILEATRLISMADRSTESEVIGLSHPKLDLNFDVNVQPFGPSTVISKLRVGTVKTNWRVEKLYFDEVKASEAVMNLYMSGVEVSTIRKSFSMGIFGERGRKRLVPTRWSITAIDSIISLNLLEKVKTYPVINEYQVYTVLVHGNRFLAILIPEKWSYELVEAWFPNTAWNPNKENIAMCSDWEPYGGRVGYASIGGCYYAARLSVAEKMYKMGRQAACIILREIYPSKRILPLGVWQVREDLRAAFRSKPVKLNNLKEVMGFVGMTLKVPLRYWFEASSLFRYISKQRKITEYLSSENIS